MSVYDVKVESLYELPSLQDMAVVSDCDGTLFEHGTTTLYPDVETMLRGVSCLALVSAFPDDQLMQERQSILGAEIGINAEKKRWYKGDLFMDAARQLGGITNSVVIMGDRPVADVGVAKAIFGHNGFDTLGVRVARPNLPIPSKLDYLLRPAFTIGATAAKLSGKDEYIRPRPERGKALAELFLRKTAN